MRYLSGLSAVRALKMVLNILPAFRRLHLKAKINTLKEDKARLLEAAQTALVYDPLEQQHAPHYAKSVEKLLAQYDGQIIQLNVALAELSAPRRHFSGTLQTHA